MKRYNIKLHIEELVLHGFAPGDRATIGAAIQGELTRLFAEQGVHPSLQHSREVEKMDAGTFHMQPGAKAGTIGLQVAHAIYGGLEE